MKWDELQVRLSVGADAADTLTGPNTLLCDSQSHSKSVSMEII